MPHIVISEFMDAPAVERLAKKFSVRYEPTLVDNPQDLAKALAGADGLIVRNRTQVNAALLANAPKVRVVGRLGVGLDNIDLVACKAGNIQVIPATGANARAVAEYVMGAALMLARGAFTATAPVAAGKWPRLAFSNGLEIENRTMGLVGFGFIGRLVADLARPFGMSIAAFDPALPENDPAFAAHGATRHATLESLLAAADVVSLHVPLTPQTRNLINAEKLALMKPTAVLINTARGGVVDEAAVVRALTANQLRGAALDVFDSEPLGAGVFPQDTASLPGLLLTPHIAGLTQEANERVSSLIAERVEQFFESA